MRLLITLLLTTLIATADINSIEDIKKEYTAIKTALPTYTQSKKELEGFSTEGGEAIIYRDNSKFIRLIKLTNYGEMGRSVEEYYFYHNTLFFIYEVTYNYNAPAYVPQHDESKTTTKKERFYFVDSKMIKWIEEGNSINPKSDTFKNKEQSIYSFVVSFLLAII